MAVTRTGAVPVVGVTASLAVGAWGAAETLTVLVVVSVSPEALETVRVTV